jgi:hypothetical protein
MDVSAAKYILYTQEDCEFSLAQFASYYYRIVAGFLDAEQDGALTVAPYFPWAPRDNAALEADKSKSVWSAVQGHYRVDCRQLLDLSAGVVCDLDEFVAAAKDAGGVCCAGAVSANATVWLDPIKRALYSEGGDGLIEFPVKADSPCEISAMPARWDTGKTIMKIFAATNKYKFRMGPFTDWPHPDYEEFLEGSKRYLVVHWKRGENLCEQFGQTADDHAVRTDPERVGESINYLISVNRKANPKAPCDGIFIATDSTVEADRAKVIQLIRKEWSRIPIFMTPNLRAVKPEQRWRWDWADLWVGSHGAAWFLSPYCAEDSSVFGRLMISNGRRFNKEMSVTFM